MICSEGRKSSLKGLLREIKFILKSLETSFQFLLVGDCEHLDPWKRRQRIHEGVLGQMSQEMGFYEEKTYRHIQWFMNVERLMKNCVFVSS